MPTSPVPEYPDRTRDVLWSNMIHAMLRLKRALDKDHPFDFIGRIGNGTLLLVGEGNLSFSAALLSHKPQLGRNAVATTFESEASWTEKTYENARFLRRNGAQVYGAIDATKLNEYFRGESFEMIVFQFPNVASRVPLYGRNPNHILIKRFLRNAAGHLTSSGCVAVTVVNSAHYDGAFDMEGAAKDSGLGSPVAYPFYFSNYPGYAHINTLGNDSAVDKNADCVTFVFNAKPQRSKLEAGRFR